MKKPARGLLGGKAVSNHSTNLDETQRVVGWMERIDSIRKVIPAAIRGAYGGGKRRIKIRAAPVGLELVVRGSEGVQNIYVHTNDPNGVGYAIQMRWEEEYGM